MKKILFAALLLSLLLALCACGDTGAAEPAGLKGKTPAEGELPLGVITRDADGTRYENEYLGFGCRLDGNWYVANEEEMAQIVGLSLDAYEGTGYEEAIRGAQIFFDFYTDNMVRPFTINLNFTRAGNMTSMSQEQYLDMMERSVRQMLEAGGMGDVQTERRTVTFAGVEMTGLHLCGLNQGEDQNSLQLYFISGDRFATLTLTTLGEDKTGELLELFYPLS